MFASSSGSRIVGIRSFLFIRVASRSIGTVPPAATTGPKQQKVENSNASPMLPKDFQNHHFKKNSINGTSKTAAANPENPLFWPNPMGNPVYSAEEVTSIQKTHRPVEGLSDRLAYLSVKMARYSFDTLSGYRFGKLTEDKVFKRAIFLETVAGVPGFVAGILRHLRSLRRMERDYGWIHTLLQEAENERMHLLTFIKLKQPGLAFRLCVIVTQGIFMNGFFFAYLINPRFCHRFVGYLEEEAVKTYTDILTAIDDGRLESLAKKPAPDIAISYWRLAPDATVRDLILAVRADEANHRDVNHTFASLKPDEKNPHIH